LSPKPIFSFSLQNSRVKGVGQAQVGVEDVERAAEGVASLTWAQIRLCLVSFSRATWWWVMAVGAEDVVALHPEPVAVDDDRSPVV
jgi:hypothetical protein